MQDKEGTGKVTLLKQNTVSLLRLTERTNFADKQDKTGTHIVGSPPGLEFEVPLKAGSQILLKVFRQALHPLILLIIHEWAN